MAEIHDFVAICTDEQRSQIFICCTLFCCGRQFSTCNALLSRKLTFFKCQPYFKGHWIAFHCWSIITTSIKLSCGPFPCHCHHRPVWLWMSVKPLILFNLFIVCQSALPTPRDSIASKIWFHITVCIWDYLRIKLPVLNILLEIFLSWQSVTDLTSTSNTHWSRLHCISALDIMTVYWLSVLEYKAAIWWYLSCAALIKSCTEAVADSVRSGPCSGLWWFQEPQGSPFIPKNSFDFIVIPLRRRTEKRIVWTEVSLSQSGDSNVKRCKGVLIKPLIKWGFVV